jgi:preprotein translocase subunit YajC
MLNLLDFQERLSRPISLKRSKRHLLPDLQQLKGDKMLTLAFAQSTQTTAQGGAQNPIMGFLPIILIFVIFYFLLIKPQKKKQQELSKMLEALKKNDEVITSGGIFGTIVNMQDDVITVRIDDNVRIKVQRNSISQLKKKQGDS